MALIILYFSPVKKGKKSANANEEGEESDYNDVEIPWGPEWASTGIVQLLNQRDKAQFFSQIRQNKAKDQHKPVSHIFVSGIDAVLNDTTRMGYLSPPPSPHFFFLGTKFFLCLVP